MIQKTKVLTLIVFGLIFLNLSAQDSFENDPVAKLPDEDRTFRFGLHFSPNLSWFKTNTPGYSSDGSKMGFSYGLNFEYFLSNNYLIYSGLTLLHSGGKLKYRAGAIYNSSVNGTTVYLADVVSDVTLKFVEIPLCLKLRTNEIGYLTYYGQFGFKTALNIGSKADFTFEYDDENTTLPNTTNSLDVADSYNFMNLSLVVGLGVEYNISGNTTLNLGLTFSNGFVNQSDMKTIIYDDDADPTFDSEGNPNFSDKDVSANLNYLALNIGIYF